MENSASQKDRVTHTEDEPKVSTTWKGSGPCVLQLEDMGHVELAAIISEGGKKYDVDLHVLFLLHGVSNWRFDLCEYLEIVTFFGLSKFSEDEWESQSLLMGRAMGVQFCTQPPPSNSEVGTEYRHASESAGVLF